jgi:hypothetical protein
LAGFGRLVARFVPTITESAMTLSEEHQVALAELENARRKGFLLKALISDSASIAEFRKANDEVIRAAVLYGALAKRLATANSQ